MSFFIRTTVLVWSLTLFLPGGVYGETIAIVNAGFEAPALNDGGFTSGGVPGWTSANSTTDYGVYNPPAAQIPAEAPEGQNVAFLVNQAQMLQTLTTALAAGSYTLTLQVGDSVDFVSPFEVQLRAGSGILAQSSSPSPANGTFTPVTVNYFATAGDPLLGQPLEIRLLRTGSDRTAQAFFDDVQLNFAAIPEPSTLLLAALATAGLSCRRRALR